MTMDQRAPRSPLHGLSPADARALLSRLLEIADDAVIVADDALATQSPVRTGFGPLYFS